MARKSFYPQVSVKQQSKYVWSVTIAFGPDDILSASPYEPKPRPALKNVGELKKLVLPLLEQLAQVRAKDVRREIPQLGYAASSVLSALYREGWLERTGEGRRGDPFRYTLRGGAQRA